MVTVIGTILAVPGKKPQDEKDFNVYLLDNAKNFLTDDAGKYLTVGKEL